MSLILGSVVMPFYLERPYMDSNISPSDNEIMLKIIRNKFNELAKKHLDIDTMAKFVVGDAKALQSQFEKLRYKVEVVDLDR
jgi:hypothetical protein